MLLLILQEIKGKKVNSVRAMYLDYLYRFQLESLQL